MPDNEKPTLLVIDGHSLAFRAFYALPVDSFQNRDGQHTNAIHGFIAMLINLLAKEKPSHLAVAFDISRYSFRTREFRYTEWRMWSKANLPNIVWTDATLMQTELYDLRQTEGLIGSIISLLGLALAVPDHSTMSRRSGTLERPALQRSGTGPLHLLVDSTGLKLGGAGEWLVEKHGASRRRS